MSKSWEVAGFGEQELREDEPVSSRFKAGQDLGNKTPGRTGHWALDPRQDGPVSSRN